MYLERFMQEDIKKAIKYFPSILITGARQVGKSTMVLQFKDYKYITLDDTITYDFAKSDPQGFISSLEKPVIIDEIQKAPELLSEIKKDIDNNRINGQFILTGSANIISFKNISDTLAGRIAIFELFPFTKKEFIGKKENLITQLFTDDFDFKLPKISSRDIKKQIILGGYPELQKIDDLKIRHIWLSSYIRTYIERDIRDIAEIRNLDSFISMYNILATLSANILNKTNLANKSNLDLKTLNHYINLLEQVYQIKKLKNYQNNIGKQFVKSPKVYFLDSGILSHLLGVKKTKDLDKSPYKGSIVETFVFSEILKYHSLLDNNISMTYFRTSDKKEIDFVLQSDEKIVAIEVKSSQSVRVSDFKHIDTFAKKINNKKFLGIVLYLGDELIYLNQNRIAMPFSLFF